MDISSIDGLISGDYLSHLEEIRSKFQAHLRCGGEYDSIASSVTILSKKFEKNQVDCSHYFIIETPHGIKSKGFCMKCFLIKKDFYNAKNKNQSWHSAYRISSQKGAELGGRRSANSRRKTKVA